MPLNPDPTVQLRQLEEQLLQPCIRQAAAAVAALLADEFIEFGSSGRIFNKSQVIQSLLAESSAAAAVPQRAIADFRVATIAPGVILCTYRLVNLDDARSNHSLRSSIWKQILDKSEIIGTGNWQLIFHQGTLMSTSNPAS